MTEVNRYELNDMRALVRRDLHDKNLGIIAGQTMSSTAILPVLLKNFRGNTSRQKATLATTAGSREISVATLTGRVI